MYLFRPLIFTEATLNCLCILINNLYLRHIDFIEFRSSYLYNFPSLVLNNYFLKIIVEFIQRTWINQTPSKKKKKKGLIKIQLFLTDFLKEHK